MFALVLFDDGVYYVCHKSRITSKSENTCCVKYTDGGRYPARLLALNADRNYLENMKRKKESLHLRKKNATIKTASHSISGPAKGTATKVLPDPGGTTREIIIPKANLETLKDPRSIGNSLHQPEYPDCLLPSKRRVRRVLFEDERKADSSNKDKKILKNDSGLRIDSETENDTSTRFEIKSNDTSNNSDCNKARTDDANATFTVSKPQPHFPILHATSSVQRQAQRFNVKEVVVKINKLRTSKIKPQLMENLNLSDSIMTCTSELSTNEINHIADTNTVDSTTNSTKIQIIEQSPLNYDEAGKTSTPLLEHATLEDLDSDSMALPDYVTFYGIDINSTSLQDNLAFEGIDSNGISLPANVTSEEFQLHRTSLQESVPTEEINFNNTQLQEDTIIEGTFIDYSLLQNNMTCEESHANDVERNSDSASEYEPSVGDGSSNASLEEETNYDDKEKCLDQSKNRSREKRLGSRNSSQNSSQNLSGNISTLTEPQRVRDDRDMFVVTSNAKKGEAKKNFCMYCKTMQCKFARHLEFVHRDVPEVKAFSALPKKSAERKKIIDTIRKNSQFFFNTNNDVNDGELIVCRRPNIQLGRRASDFQVCHNCKGFFSKNNIRHHAQRCFGYNGKKSRTLTIMGRQVVARIHEAASDRLIRVFSILREDEVVRLIRYDRLRILYGNKMCQKYKKQHDGDMIRAHLRLLGRFLAALEEINKDVVEFATLYDPKFYDDVITAINVVSQFNEETNTYEHPSTAYNLGSFIKKIGNQLVTDCIKRHDTVQKANTEDFLKLALEDIGVSINKTVVESQTQQKRRKKTELPSVKDIQKLLAHIDEKRNAAYQSIQTKFTFDAWLTLAQTTLTSIQVFNRRRAGEIERVFIEDFENYEGIDIDLFGTLSADAQVLAKKYVRFVIRGKLNRTVPVLLSSNLLACLKMILKYRDQAKVPSKNQYLFGIPGFEKNRYKYLRACYLLRKFSQESGADFPTKLTGTKLRKHIATNCITLNLSENEVNDVANFMGHADKIHRDHYRQPIVSREILRMSKVLESALGGVENDNESDASDDTDNERVNCNNNTRFCGKEIPTGNLMPTRQPSIVIDNASYQMSCNVSEGDNDSSDRVDDPPAARKRKATSIAEAGKKVKKRSTSPYGAVKSKPRWTEDENKIAFQLFEKNIEAAKYPSLKTIQKLCSGYPCLSRRSPSVIKTWISNKIKKTKR